MASTTTPISCSSSSSTTCSKAVPRGGQPPTTGQCVTLPTLAASPPIHHHQSSRVAKTTAYCKKMARNVVAMATGEAPADVSTELPEFIKTIQDTWEKVEDKYAVTSLGVAAGVALWGSSGLLSAIDRLPLVPGVLELVGIGYTGWFAYKNLIFKPDREALIQKIKATYGEIIGTS